MPFRSTSRIFTALFGALVCAAVLPAPAAFATGIDTPTGVTALPFSIEGTRVMTMTQTGLGIGATAPVAVLDVSSAGYTQAASVTISARGTSGKGNSFEWGHSNQSGYGSVLGFQTSSGQPFLCFSCESGSNTNTFRTRGIEGIAIESDNLGDLTFNNVTSANADLQSLTERMRIASSGNVGIGATNPQRTLDVSTSGQMTFGDNVTATATATGIYWHSVTPNGSPDTAGAYGIFRTPGGWSGNYAQLEMEFPTGIIIDGGSCCGKSGTELQPNGGNVGIGKYPAAPLDVNGGIRGNSSGTVAGDACSPEGMLAYDMTNHQPVYCSSSGTWSASFMPGFTNRTYHLVNNAAGNNYYSVPWTNTYSYPAEAIMICQYNSGSASATTYISKGGSGIIQQLCSTNSGSASGCSATYTIPPGDTIQVYYGLCNAQGSLYVLY